MLRAARPSPEGELAYVYRLDGRQPLWATIRALHAPPSAHFTRDRLALIARIERQHFWFDGRRRLVARWLQARRATLRGAILDVGCGTGAVAEHLRGLGHDVFGIDELAAHARVPVARADARRLPIAAGSCGAVLMLDVLEHTDDVAVLEEARRVTRDDGVAIVTVPAWPRLWTARDDRAGHRRRYTWRSLHAVAGRAGWTVAESTSYQCLLFPLFAISRLRARRRPEALAAEETPPGALNGLLTAVTRLEVGLGRWIRWPVGSTLAAVLVKAPAARGL